MSDTTEAARLARALRAEQESFACQGNLLEAQRALATAQARIAELEKELEQGFADHRRIDEARIAELESQLAQPPWQLMAERESLKKQVELLRAALGDPKELFHSVQRMLDWCRDYGAVSAYGVDVQALADHCQNCVIAAERFDAQQEKPHDQ